jgi:hypothetical protein
MKIYSAQHRAIVEAPIMKEPELLTPYDPTDERNAYNDWISTHIPVLPEHQHIFKDGVVYPDDSFEIKYFVKTTSYQGDGGGTFDTLREAEKKYNEWAKYDGQLKSKAYPPVRVAIPITQQVSEKGGGYYFKLFKFFSDQHDLTLLDSEIQDIIHAVNEFQSEEDKEPLPQQDSIKYFPLDERLKKIDAIADSVDFEYCRKYDLALQIAESKLSEALKMKDFYLSQLKKANREIDVLYAETLQLVKNNNELKDKCERLELKAHETLQTIKSQEAEIAELRKKLKSFKP